MTLAFNFADMYERELVAPLFRPWVDEVLDAVELAASDRLLDLACGTGIVARTARERLGGRARIVGLDQSPDMLGVAKSTEPSIEWHEGNATALPFASESFDVVTCQQGLQFFPDRAVAAAEIRRVLAPSGRVAVATWRPVDELPLLRALQSVAERHVGAITDRRHGFGDAGALEELLSGAGFDDVKVRTLSRPIRFDDATSFVRMNAMALVGMSTGSAERSPDERSRLVDLIARDSAPALPPSPDGVGLVFELRTNLATATRPA